MKNTQTSNANPNPVPLPESDSIPRILLPDLFRALREFEREPVRTLEDLRLKLCASRGKSPTEDRFWATARDNAVELQKLGWIKAAGGFPKDRRAYQSMRLTKLKMTDVGQNTLTDFNANVSVAYERLFSTMYSTHP
jgi:hypothetical protein